MLALCLMLLASYYALNYAGIIGRCLSTGHFQTTQTQLNNSKESVASPDQKLLV